LAYLTNSLLACSSPFFCHWLTWFAVMVLHTPLSETSTSAWGSSNDFKFL
jgi:hypothetical protein